MPKEASLPSRFCDWPVRTPPPAGKLTCNMLAGTGVGENFAGDKLVVTEGPCMGKIKMGVTTWQVKGGIGDRFPWRVRRTCHALIITVPYIQRSPRPHSWSATVIFWPDPDPVTLQIFFSRLVGRTHISGCTVREPPQVGTLPPPLGHATNVVPR